MTDRFLKVVLVLSLAWLGMFCWAVIDGEWVCAAGAALVLALPLWGVSLWGVYVVADALRGGSDDA